MSEKGICHICQKKTTLTFEHIPPHKAFNFQPVKSIEGDEIMKLITDTNRMPWETEGLQYIQKQRGMGIHSLCKKCNNITGKYYGNEYIKFAHTINRKMPELLKICKKNDTNIAGLMVKGINPLLFAKQVLSMFCSICPNLTKNDPSIIDLLMNKGINGFDFKKYRLSMFLLDQCRISYNGMQSQFINGVGTRILASIDAYPFGFVLEFNPILNINKPELDITNFLNDYEDKEYNIEFWFPILERNNLFSCDYNSKEEIRNNAKRNR